MLLNFATENYRSIRDRQILSLMAVDNLSHEASLQVTKEGVRTLPLVLLFGANASGKSNVILALNDMRNMVLESIRLNPDDQLVRYEPFLLSSTMRGEATTFEIDFTLRAEGEEQHYRYGFSFLSDRIKEEWLYQHVGEEVLLFHRIESSVQVNKEHFPEGENKDTALNDNRLFLSLVAQLKGLISTRIISWFSKQCLCISALSTERYMGKTAELLSSGSNYAQLAKTFLRDIDISVQDLFIEAEPVEKENLPQELQEALKEFIDKGMIKLRVQSEHNSYNDSGQIISKERFDLEAKESAGTQKITELLGILFEALREGNLLAVDELDAKLHPLLTRAIIQLFTSPHINKSGAQLIFTTHDTNQLDLGYVRRDEIWFTQKDETEATELYSHIEFEDFREADSLADEYVSGRYGAIPRIRITRG